MFTAFMKRRGHFLLVFVLGWNSEGFLVPILSEEAKRELHAQTTHQSSQIVEDLAATERRIQKAVESVQRSVVGVGIGRSSGVIVSENGYVLTTAVQLTDVDHPIPIRVADSRIVQAKLVETDPTLNVSLIKMSVDDNWPKVELNQPAQSGKPGDWCIEAGYPPAYGSQKSPSIRIGRILGGDRHWFASDCLSCGCGEGSPVFDSRGKLIGLSAATDEHNRFRFHVNVDGIYRSWKALFHGSDGNLMQARRPFLGISFMDRRRSNEVTVETVVAGARAGILREDVIVRFNGEPITTLSDFLLRLREQEPGDKISLDVRRREQTQRHNIVLSGQPVSAQTGFGLRIGPSLVNAWRRSWLENHPDVDRYRKKNTSLSQKLSQSIVSTRSATVRILTNGQPVGLGIVVAEEGIVLTKHSLLRGTVTCRLSNGSEVAAEVIGSHKDHDIGLLRLRGAAPKPVVLRDEGSLAVGSLLIAVGELDKPLAIGAVSTERYRVPGRTLQQRRARSSGIGWISTIEGDIVGPIERKSPAARSGLRRGDLILTVDAKSVRLIAQLREAFREHRAGQTVTLEVLRDGTREAISLTSPEEIDDVALQHHGALLSARRFGFPIVIQHDAHTQRPNCGGALVGVDGKVAAINISRPHLAVTYALPSDVIRMTLREILVDR